ncbi:DUF3612 domain-containing protein [Vibrio sp.]|nr:DUF3612 domain-containing protein [Vibrio sp.]
MTVSKNLIRQSHFLGNKIRNLRKRNHLTMEDLSARCIRISADYAPSISYLSMIERGKRVPSAEMLEVIAEVFQKPIAWFLDGHQTDDDINPVKGNRGGIAGMALEPHFLFSDVILQSAIPELLTQTGTTGKEFAQLLIRAHQESHQNQFPDLEKAAENIGKKQLNLSVEQLVGFIKKVGLIIRWFEEPPKEVLDELGNSANHLLTSYFEAPNILHINKSMKQFPARLKYDLSVFIGHSILHDIQSCKALLAIGHTSSWETSTQLTNENEINPSEILQAWQSFESSFFAGALLCPKVPYRQLLDRSGYEISVHEKIGVSPSVAMRRMTVVSPYPHWHYFDAFGKGKLKAVYRGNGIPLPWGNMRLVKDPCQHWSVFRTLSQPSSGTSAQLSVLDVNGEPRLYCCESINITDPAGNKRVLCAGIDLIPALEAKGDMMFDVAETIKRTCQNSGGSAAVPIAARKEIIALAKILNIQWLERSLENEARLICSRGNRCPRLPCCY